MDQGLAGVVVWLFTCVESGGEVRLGERDEGSRLAELGDGGFSAASTLRPKQSHVVGEAIFNPGMDGVETRRG